MVIPRWKVCCRGRGEQDSIEAYVSSAMLQDPWAALMKQDLSQQEQQAAIKPLPAHAVDSINAGQGHSLSDAFAAAEQVCCCLYLDLTSKPTCGWWHPSAHQLHVA